MEPSPLPALQHTHSISEHTTPFEYQPMHSGSLYIAAADDAAAGNERQEIFEKWTSGDSHRMPFVLDHLASLGGSVSFFCISSSFTMTTGIGGVQGVERT